MVTTWQLTAAANAAKVVLAALRLPGLYVDIPQASNVITLFLAAAPELQRERDRIEQALPSMLGHYRERDKPHVPNHFGNLFAE